MVVVMQSCRVWCLSISTGYGMAWCASTSVCCQTGRSSNTPRKGKGEGRGRSEAHDNSPRCLVVIVLTLVVCSLPPPKLLTLSEQPVEPPPVADIKQR